jgi:hypothetical protein
MRLGVELVVPLGGQFIAIISLKLLGCYGPSARHALFFYDARKQNGRNGPDLAASDAAVTASRRRSLAWAAIACTFDF